MSKERRYRLLKDTPNSKSGDIYIYTKSGGSYAYFKDGNPNSDSWFFVENVESNSEWFEEIVEHPVKERIRLIPYNWFAEGRWYGQYIVETQKQIPENKLHLIKESIEGVLNNDTVEASESNYASVSKEWEIVSVRKNNGMLCYTDLLPRNEEKIEAVRRLSDGEVFTVGNVTKDGKITGFEVYDKNYLSVKTNMLGISSSHSLEHSEKIVQPKEQDNIKVLFVTEDGVPIPKGYEGELWRIFTVPSSYEMWKPYNLGMPRWINIGEKYFSTEKAANEYILMNKPCLSIMDITYQSKILGSEEIVRFFETPLFSLKEVVKQKIKNQ